MPEVLTGGVSLVDLLMLCLSASRSADPSEAALAEYRTTTWPTLRGAVTSLLTTTPGQPINLSFERMYTASYKSVLSGLGDQLHADLMALVESHVKTVSAGLQGGQSLLLSFTEALRRYCYAIATIGPMFMYLDKNYVQPRLHTCLDHLLKHLFTTNVCERYMRRVIAELSGPSAAAQPEAAAMLVRTLYQFKPEYRYLHPCLFARYIPELQVLAPSQVSELHSYIAEVRVMVDRLQGHPDFRTGDVARKRPLEDDMEE